MSWNDKATDKQVYALMHMISSKTSIQEGEARSRWLQNNLPTRKAMSNELGRVRDLCIENAKVKPWGEKLQQQLFQSEIWKNYKEVEDVFEDF